MPNEWHVDKPRELTKLLFWFFFVPRGALYNVQRNLEAYVELARPDKRASYTFCTGWFHSGLYFLLQKMQKGTHARTANGCEKLTQCGSSRSRHTNMTHVTSYKLLYGLVKITLLPLSGNTTSTRMLRKVDPHNLQISWP